MSAVLRRVETASLQGIRSVEFDEVVDESHDTSALAGADWMERVGAPPRRVHRHAPDGLAVAELPTIEVLVDEPEPEPEPTPDELEAAEQRRNDAIAFAAGYRAGHSEGLAIGAEQGHREGLAVGRREAVTEHRAVAAALLDRVEAELARHAGALDELSAAIAASATELAFEIAEAVLARELELSRSPGVDAIRRAANLLPDTGADAATVVVRLHPADLTLLGGDTVDELLPGRKVEVCADPAVERGGCVLDSGASRVDASISAALARVRQVLLP